MPLQNSYALSSAKAKDVASSAASSPLAVYIHWPYCARICPYCDFNVFKQRRDDGLVGAIMADLSAWRDWSDARIVTSVHFGGGTPSLMSGTDIAAILNHIDQLWGLGDGAELGLEANPNNSAIDKLEAFKAAGLNRLSFGIQSFNEEALKQLGRDHDGISARAALDRALPLFSSISADLIFGWHGQTLSDLKTDLDIALSAGVPHLSAYQLTIEEGTAFAKAQARGEPRAVGDDQSADLYDYVQERLTVDSFIHYEVSNFAKQGHQSRHNLAYWQGHDYVGVGPGAHGRLTHKGQRFATIAAMRPNDYKSRVKAAGLGITEKDALTNEAWRDEYVLMGLRITDGISLTRLNAIYPDPHFDAAVTSFAQEGYLLIKGDRLFTAPKGRAVLNHITEKLLAG